MLDGKILSWWEKLSDDERNILIELLYNLPLDEYISKDTDGTYIGLL